MSKISVIIVYNKKEQLDKAAYYLSLQTLYAETERIFLDNRNKQFGSAAEALNFGAQMARGEVLVFMHQDVYLYDKNILTKYYEYLSAHKKTVAGLAGVTEAEKDAYSDISETEQKIKSMRPTEGKIIPVIALDECMFGMTKTRWNELKFDENTCNDWHFYGVEICYNNALHGGRNVVLSADACHESKGNPRSRAFEKSLKNMIRKYRGKADFIATTCVRMKCNYKSYYWFAIKRRIKGLLTKIKGEKV